MRNFILAFCCLFLLEAASAQISFGVKAGAAINGQTNSSSSVEKSLIGIQSAVFAKIQLSSSIIFQPSLGYYAKGKKFNNISFEDQFGNDIGYGDMNVRFDYLELAAPFQYIFSDKKIRLAGGLGPFLSYAVGGTLKYKYEAGQPTNEPKTRPIIFGTNGANRIDAGVQILLSAFLNDRWVISANYDQGLTNIDSYSKKKNMSGGISVGYFFR